MPVARTYLIGLYIVVNAAYRYASHWQPKIAAHVDAPTLACVNALIAAMAECLPLITPAPPSG